MNKIIKLIVLISILNTQYSILNCQTQPLSSTNSKAIKLYEKAVGLYQSRKDADAKETALQAIEKDPNFTEPYLLLATIYEDARKPELAIEEYKKIFVLNSRAFPNAYFNCGMHELRMGRYSDAKTHLEKFLSFGQANPDSRANAEKGIADCNFTAEAMKRPVPFDPVNLGKSINSPDDEYFPSITADDQTIIYTRDIKDAEAMSGHQEDFYISDKVDGKWNEAYNMGVPVNTHQNEGAPSLSADGQTLILVASAGIDGYGPNRKGFGSCDIFYSIRTGNQWSQPRNVNPPINTKNWETQPSFSSDGKTLYFIRGMETRGGVKDQDIYMSQISDQGWSTPVKLSDKVNTPGKEESVFIHPDNSTLYFASDGHPGMGGTDLYMSRRQANGEWGPAMNLGFPINTYNDENSLLVGPNGDIAYYASDKEGGFGGMDLYSFELYEGARPEKITYVKGKVYDSKTRKPLAASFELIDLKTSGTIVESQSNAANGEFLLTLPINRDYALNVSKSAYVFYSENFSLKGIDVSQPFAMDIPLQPIDTGVTVELKNIFFETAKFDLKDESKVELKKLVSFLILNSTLKIEISGHTDNVGDKKLNQVLSQNRAKAVYDHLVNNALPKDRLVYKGYGDTKPKVANDTDENRAKNRRTEFKVLSR